MPADFIHFSLPDISADDIRAVAHVLEKGWITTGPVCQALESSLAEFLDVPRVVATSSCTAAMEIALAYLGLPAGGRVGVPTWTFASSALVPARAGLRPVLLDVHADSLNISESSLSQALDGGLDAVVGVHFGGVPFSRSVHELCADRGVPVIEDAAHALGATDHRGLVAGRGTAGACFSFYATKNLTCAEGGALATEDEALADFAETFRSHGMSRDSWARYAPGGPVQYDVTEPGIKGNLPDVLAALALSQLDRFDEMQRRRREIVRRYRSNLAGVADLRFVPEQLDENSADHLCVVVLPERVERHAIAEGLSRRGISSSVHFRPLHRMSWFASNAETGPSGLATAEQIADRVLSLPLHTKLTDAQVDRIGEALSAELAP